MNIKILVQIILQVNIQAQPVEDVVGQRVPVIQLVDAAEGDNPVLVKPVCAGILIDDDGPAAQIGDIRVLAAESDDRKVRRE